MRECTYIEHQQLRIGARSTQARCRRERLVYFNVTPCFTPFNDCAPFPDRRQSAQEHPAKPAAILWRIVARASVDVRCATMGEKSQMVAQDLCGHQHREDKMRAWTITFAGRLSFRCARAQKIGTHTQTHTRLDETLGRRVRIQ